VRNGNVIRCLVLASLMIPPLVAQSSPAFEVASIRLNRSGGQRGGVLTPRGNQWMARNATLRTLVRFAYGSDGDELTSALRDEFLVVGGPSWIDTEAYDIVATMPAVPVRKLGDSALMLQRLLAERFSLKVHMETRELPAWALVRARRDGRLQPELRPSSGQCVPQSERVSRDQRRCGVSNAFQGMIANSASMTHLAAALTPILGRTVIDRTALSGTFDFNLRFTDGLTPDARFPSLSTALEEQLGLKLESMRAPADVVVIDSVQRPTDN
jgi:uncharacterized protein (TIGR03435 family)